MKCTTNQDVMPGESLPDIVVQGDVGRTELRHIMNIATVSSPGDINPDNDSDDDPIDLGRTTRTAPAMSPIGEALGLLLLLTLGFFGLRRAAARRR